MDGTTLNSEYILTQYTIDTIRRAASAGVRVIIATGRPASALQRYIDELALPQRMPVVCFNGACAMYMATSAALAAPASGEKKAGHELLYADPLDATAAHSVLAMCERFGWCASYVQPLRTVASPRSEEHERLLRNFEAKEGITQLRAVPDSTVALIAAGHLPLKIVSLASDPLASAARARDALPAGLVNVVAAEMHVEFLAPSVTKGSMLVRLCREALDIPLEDVIAFGDNHNDKEMFAFVGESVAMRNAHEEVKAVASRVCAWSNDEDGVARELEVLLGAAAL